MTEPQRVNTVISKEYRQIFWQLAAILGDKMMNTIKLLICAVLSFAGLSLASVANAHDHDHFRFGIHLGFPLGYPAPYYAAPYYPAPYYPEPYYRPAVPVYVQPQTVIVQPPVPSQVVYQYYCAPTGAYYPTVPTCSQPWMKVLPDGSQVN